MLALISVAIAQVPLKSLSVFDANLLYINDESKCRVGSNPGQPQAFFLDFSENGTSVLTQRPRSSSWNSGTDVVYLNGGSVFVDFVVDAAAENVLALSELPRWSFCVLPVATYLYVDSDPDPVCRVGESGSFTGHPSTMLDFQRVRHRVPSCATTGSVNVGGLSIGVDCSNSDSGTPTTVSVSAANLNVAFDGATTTVWRQVSGYDTTSSVFLLLIFVAALIAWVPWAASVGEREFWVTMQTYYVVVADLLIIVMFTAVTSFNDDHVYFYSPAASQMTAIEDQVPMFMLVSTVVYATAALVILFANTDHDVPLSLRRRRGVTQIAVLTATALTLSAIVGGLFYWYTESSTVGIGVGAYSAGLSCFLIGIWHYKKMKNTSWSKSDYTFRWLVDLLIFTAIHSFIPPELGQNVRNSVSFALGLSLSVAIGRDIVIGKSASVGYLASLVGAIFACFHIVLVMVGPPLLSPVSLQGRDDVAIWLSSALTACGVGGGALSHAASHSVRSVGADSKVAAGISKFL